MKVTKQQKFLGVVLVIGLGAICCDRLFVLTAAPAVAANEAEYALPATSRPAGPAATPTKTISVAERLRNAGAGASTSPSRDVFSLADIWGIGKQQVVTTNPSSDRFRQVHRLTGVLTSGGRIHAMIDGQIVGVGQVIDGFRLASISGRSVVFEASGESITLEMSEGGRSAVAGVQ